ncbi:MAG TPA: hypothetical protein VGR60_07235, partial [Gemmatimonadales bacterium]|nr:hypothetical protein [Gemmatimonadales bacterium]
MAAILLAATACEVHRPRPTIALSYPVYGGPYAAVAESLAHPGRSGAPPRILYDTADAQETSEGMVAWAQRIGRMREVVGVVGP